MERYRYAILYHNYYDADGIDELRSKIAALNEPGILLLCSLPDKFAGLRPPQRDAEKFVVAANVGKDIGGKLILVELLLRLYADTPYAIFLHDKRSYQKHSGRWEKDGLFSIVSPEKFPRIAAAFDRDAGMGIACAAGHVRNEYLGSGTFNTKNSELLRDLMKKYSIGDADLRFVAGTMFWIRTSLLRDFFSREDALAVRATLESGNVLDQQQGTMTHCWERMLSWIALSTGSKLKEF